LQPSPSLAAIAGGRFSPLPTMTGIGDTGRG
jgi:hypothetical protein